MTLYLAGSIDGRRVRWRLDGPCHRVGRAVDSDVQIAHPTVSKRHASITCDVAGWRVCDLASRNGTRVNGRPVGEGAPLAAGDRLEFGQVALFVDDHAVERDASDEVPVLPGASMAIPAGQILARGRQDAGARAVHLLAEAGRLLVLPETLEATFEQILAIVERAVPTGRVVLLLDEGGGGPRPVASRTRGRATREPLTLSRTILRHVMDECSCVLVQDAPSDPRFHGRQSLVAERVNTAIAVPLVDGDRVLGLLYVDHDDGGPAYGERELEIMTLLANMAAVKITNTRLHEAEARHARIEQELAMARGIQCGMLPEVTSAPRGYRCHVHLQTCHEVGGDLYDWFTAADGAIYVLIGDVAGKGFGAALLMSSVVTSARMLYEDAPTPAELARRLNAMIHRSTPPELFVTAIVGRLDPATHRLAFVNAGHPRPLVLVAGATREIEGAGMPLGVTAEPRYVEQAIDLAPGSTIALYTDGITEARRDDEFLGVGGLVDLLGRTSGDLETRCHETLAALAAFRGGQPTEDDLTLILLERS